MADEDDDDEAGVAVSPTKLDMDEVGSETYTAGLASRRTAAVTVTIASTSGKVSTNPVVPDLHPVDLEPPRGR